MVACPAPTVVARPALLMLTTEVEDELQVTPLARSCDEPSLYVAVAMYCELMPMPRVSPSGVIVIAVIVGAVIVSVVEPVMLPSVAEIVVVPADTPTAATVESEELHCTDTVMSLVLPSEKVPVAVKFCVAPLAIEEEFGDNCKAESEVVPLLPEPDGDPPLQPFSIIRTKKVIV